MIFKAYWLITAVVDAVIFVKFILQGVWEVDTIETW